MAPGLFLSQKSPLAFRTLSPFALSGVTLGVQQATPTHLSGPKPYSDPLRTRMPGPGVTDPPAPPPSPAVSHPAVRLACLHLLLFTAFCSSSRPQQGLRPSVSLAWTGAVAHWPIAGLSSPPPYLCSITEGLSSMHTDTCV